MLLHAERSNSDAGQAKLGNGTIDLGDCGRDILKRDETDPLKSRALFTNAGDPIIVAAAISGGVVLLWTLCDGKAGGRKENGHFNSFRVHIPESRWHIGNVHAQFAVHAGIPFVPG